MKRNFSLVEHFGSIQGEGYWAGVRAFFIRFAGCNLESHCGELCDTDITEQFQLSPEQLIELLELTCWRRIAPYKFVVFTGGEPMLQLTPKIVRAVIEVGALPIIETNGIFLERGDYKKAWIVYSPKCVDAMLDLKLENASEVKVVPGLLEEDACLSIGRWCEKHNKPFSVQPLEKDGLYDVESCMRLLKHCPQARLSVQMHKFLNLR